MQNSLFTSEKTRQRRGKGFYSGRKKFWERELVKEKGGSVFSFSEGGAREKGEGVDAPAVQKRNG